MPLRDGLRTVTSTGRPWWLGNALFIGACAVAAAVASVVFAPSVAPQHATTARPPHHQVPAKRKPTAPAAAPIIPTTDAAVSVKPSFDCSKVHTAVPRLICGTPILAALDQELATAYQAALAASTIPELLRASQSVWITERNAAPANSLQLAARYVQRIEWLKHVNDPSPPASEDQTSQPSEEDPNTMQLGTAFFVSDTGKLVTNAHVVRGCYQIAVRRHDGTISGAHVLAADPADDLALAQMDAPGQYPAVSIRADVPKLGESISIFGFPLPGVLASSGNMTFGNVSALSGVGDNTGQLQISAPVQPGNSGGAVLDTAGDLIGVVVAKLDGPKMASITHDIPQNVNFAIKAAVLTNFLSSHSLQYTTAASDAVPLDTSGVADLAQNVTAQVFCKPGEETR